MITSIVLFSEKEPVTIEYLHHDVLFKLLCKNFMFVKNQIQAPKTNKSHL